MNGMFWVYVAYLLGIGLMLGYGASIVLSIRHVRGRTRGPTAGHSAVLGGAASGRARHGDFEVKG